MVVDDAAVFPVADGAGDVVVGIDGEVEGELDVVVAGLAVEFVLIHVVPLLLYSFCRHDR